MGLSRAICKRCRETSKDRNPVLAVPWHDVVDIPAWRNGTVICPAWDAGRHGIGSAQTDRPPPSWCPFAAEHAVAHARIRGG